MTVRWRAQESAAIGTARPRFWRVARTVSYTHLDVYKRQVLEDLHGLLTENRIFKQRNVDIGVVTEDDIQAYGFSGVMVRLSLIHI